MTDKIQGVGLADIVRHCDELLKVAEIADYPNALNGLQIENAGRVTRIGDAVDACLRSLDLAIEHSVDLLVVHHGIFWPGLRPITGAQRELLRKAFAHNVALYSAHIPLDVHPELGNNAQLMRALRIEGSSAFFEWKNVLLGQRADVEITREDLVDRLEKLLGCDVRVVGGGPANIRALGVITGGAGGEIFEIAKLGIDTFVTGEAPHWAAVVAHDLKINLIVAGHYATETFGVRALAANLSEKFGVPHEFIDCPTGF